MKRTHHHVKFVWLVTLLLIGFGGYGLWQYQSARSNQAAVIQLLGPEYVAWQIEQQRTELNPVHAPIVDEAGGALVKNDEQQLWKGLRVETNGGEPTLTLDFGSLVVGTPVITTTSDSGGDMLVRYYDMIDGQPYQPLIQETGFSLATGTKDTTDQERLFRYMELTFRNHPGSTTIDDVRLTGIRRHQATGYFTSSDADLNAIWRMGVRSADLSTTSTLIDSPHRDNATWLGDARETALINQYVFGDPRSAEATLELFAERLNDQGAMIAVAGLSPDDHETWVFLDYLGRYVTMLWEHYNFYGDTKILEKYADVAFQQLEFFEQFRNDQGLLVIPDDLAPANDWSSGQRSGIVAYHQIVYVTALADAASIAAVLDDDEQEQEYNRQAYAVRQAAVAILSDPSSRLLLDFSASAGTESPRIPFDANILGINQLLFETEDGSSGYEHELLAVLESKVAGEYGWQSLDRPYSQLDVRHNLAPLMNAEAVHALFVQGKRTEAIALAKQHWGRMVDAGSSTAWEYMGTDGSIAGSISHGWSGKVSRYLQQDLLGLTIDRSNSMSRLYVAPQSLGGLSSVAGAVPFPEGVVAVYLEEQESGHLLLDIVTPPGLTPTIMTPLGYQASNPFQPKAGRRERVEFTPLTPSL